MTHLAKFPERPKGMRKDRTVLERPSLMVWPDNIKLDGST